MAFHLSFGLRKKAKATKTSKALRIPTGMRGIQDAIPPDGFPTAFLSTVNLFLDYSAGEQQREGVQTTKIGTSTFTENPQLDKELNYYTSSFLKGYPTSLPEDFHLDQAFYALFNSGFRNLIVDTQPDARRKVEYSESDERKPLSRICPTAFSLGYCDVSYPPS